MRKLLLFALATMLSAACAKDALNEPSGIATPETRTLSVSFDSDSTDTRIQLNEEKKTAWTEGDLLSVFYRSTTNEQWQFTGATGDRTGDIVPVDSSVVPTPTTNDIVVVYPYNAGYFYNSDTKNVQASLPAEQTYLKDSYGLDGNILVSRSEYNQVSLKSVCGWLKLQLTGAGESVRSITLRGNNGEQVAGELYINTSDATATLASADPDSDSDEGTGEAGGTLVRPGTILTEVTLNCGEGVTLGSEATSFYIALPPQTFSAGFTVEIEATDGSTMTKSTNNEVTIERNTIQPMKALAYSRTSPANNEIWYTNGSTTTATAPYKTNVFGANIVSNLYDAEKECWVITFDGEVKTIGDYAFLQKQALRSIHLPNSATTIGNGAFEWCIYLESVNIPQKLISIGDWAFHCCWELKKIIIPDSVTSIGNNTFYECRELEDISIGCSVKEIGECAFYYCYNLKRIIIPDSVTKIGAAAFRLCSALVDIVLSNNLEIINKTTFCECYSLSNITIPMNITSIGESAFSDCKNLKEVYCKPSNPPTGVSQMFKYWDYSYSVYRYIGCKIYVPVGSGEAYKTAEYWSEYADDIYEYNY